MTKEGWKKIILKCSNDNKSLDLLSKLLEEHDAAKQLLTDKGYRCTGMSLLETIKDILRKLEQYKYNKCCMRERELYDFILHENSF